MSVAGVTHLGGDATNTDGDLVSLVPRAPVKDMWRKGALVSKSNFQCILSKTRRAAISEKVLAGGLGEVGGDPEREHCY